MGQSDQDPDGGENSDFMDAVSRLRAKGGSGLNETGTGISPDDRVPEDLTWGELLEVLEKFGAGPRNSVQIDNPTERLFNLYLALREGEVENPERAKGYMLALEDMLGEGPDSGIGDDTEPTVSKVNAARWAED